MATWASRRKFIYGGSVIGLILVLLVTGYFTLVYKAPTCFDAIKNGGEQDVDCGGHCVKLCQSAFLPAKIEWGGGKFEKIANGLYNVASYIINPNTNGSALNVPYKFSLYDDEGVLITERKGSITIPAHRNTLAFESAVDTGNRVPAKVTFEFLEAPVWFKSHDVLDGLTIVDKKYSENETSSSLEVTLSNKSLLPYSNITVAAVLYDIDGNAIGFSKTEVDSLSPNGGTALAPFTWPFSRENKVVSIEALPVIAPLRD